MLRVTLHSVLLAFAFLFLAGGAIDGVHSIGAPAFSQTKATDAGKQDKATLVDALAGFVVSPAQMIAEIRKQSANSVAAPTLRRLGECLQQYASLLGQARLQAPFTITIDHESCVRVGACSGKRQSEVEQQQVASAMMSFLADELRGKKNDEDLMVWTTVIEGHWLIAMGPLRTEFERTYMANVVRQALVAADQAATQILSQCRTSFRLW